MRMGGEEGFFLQMCVGWSVFLFMCLVRTRLWELLVEMRPLWLLVFTKYTNTNMSVYAVPWRWLSAGGASEGGVGGGVGGCSKQGPSKFPLGGGDLLSHPVKVSHWYSVAHMQKERETHTKTHTYTHADTHSGILQTLHRKLWAIMWRHLGADGRIAQTKWDMVQLW